MTKYHLGDDGQPRECRADYNCPKGGEAPHFTGSIANARAWAEEQNSQAAGGSFHQNSTVSTAGSESAAYRSEGSIQRDVDEALDDIKMYGKQHDNLKAKQSQGFTVEKEHFDTNKRNHQDAVSRLDSYRRELDGLNGKDEGIHDVDAETQKVVDQARAEYEASRSNLTKGEYDEKVLSQQIDRAESNVNKFQHRVDTGYVEDPRVSTNVMNSRGEFVSENEYELEEAQSVLKQLYAQRKMLNLENQGKYKAAEAYQKSLEHSDKNKYFGDLRAKQAKLAEDNSKAVESNDETADEPAEENTADEANSASDEGTGGNNKKREVEYSDVKPFAEGNTDKTVKYFEARAARADKRLKLAKEALEKDPSSEDAQDELLQAQSNASEAGKDASSARNGDEMHRGTATVAGAEIAVGF